MRRPLLSYTRRMSGRLSFDRPQPHRRGAALTLVFGAVIATGAATGSFGGPGARLPDTAALVALPPVDPGTAGIARAIRSGRVSPRTAAELVSRSGDRWSAFYTPLEYEGFQQTLDGRYVGVGLWVRRSPDGRMVIRRVQPDSPAQRAGLRVGDRLLAVDGVPVTGRSVTGVVARLRGDDADGAPDGAPARPGSTVALGLQRGSRAWTVTLHRALLSTESVTVSRPAPGVTEIAVGAFVRGTAEQVRRALATGDHSQGILLDLRGNSGGLVDEAVAAASAFLDGGPVAGYDDDGRRCLLDAAEGGDTRTPLVVLVDGGTMSAAEMLAGALQDRGRAVVVGSRTFGKGSVQLPSTLPDGSVAELTVGHYRTPSGRDVDGLGIEPDVPVGPGRSAEAAALTVLSGLGARS